MTAYSCLHRNERVFLKSLARRSRLSDHKALGRPLKSFPLLTNLHLGNFQKIRKMHFIYPKVNFMVDFREKAKAGLPFNSDSISIVERGDITASVTVSNLFEIS